MFTDGEVVHKTGVVGEDLTLHCTETTALKDSLHWWLYRRGLPDLRFCYAGEIREDLTDKYILKNVTDGYDLIITHLVSEDGGSYVCKWSRPKRGKVEFLVTVKQTPTTAAHPFTSTDAAGKIPL